MYDRKKSTQLLSLLWAIIALLPCFFFDRTLPNALKLLNLECIHRFLMLSEWLEDEFDNAGNDTAAHGCKRKN